MLSVACDPTRTWWFVLREENGYQVVSSKMLPSRDEALRTMEAMKAEAMERKP